jgi:hypothetical protein
MNGLPLDQYGFALITVPERAPKSGRREMIHDNLQLIDGLPGVSDRQSKKLRGLIGGCIATPPADSGKATLTQLWQDMETSSPTVKQAVVLAIQKELGIKLRQDQFSLAFERIGVRDRFRVSTDLENVLKVVPEKVHQVVARGILGVSGLNKRLEMMQRYNTVSGFQNDELPLFDRRVSLLARQLDPHAHEERFERVLSITGLPTVDPDPDVHDVDLPRLLDLLDGEELREFRSWLRSLDSLDDEEVEGEVSKLKAALGEAVHGTLGKIVRFSATTGLGFVPGLQLPALGLGALDSLLVEKLIPEAGPTAFLSRHYPKIFKEP